MLGDAQRPKFRGFLDGVAKGRRLARIPAAWPSTSWERRERFFQPAAA